MKKYVITGVLCFLVCLSFGQKKAVSAAKSEIKGNNPNIAEARMLIKGALVNPETANDAETWYVAGDIENKQFDKERAKEILGGKANEEVMYKALEGILPYFIKAAELDLRPDAKGKVKPKFIKNIRSIVRLNRQFYVNAGIFANDKQDYRKAYENFKTYGDIPKLSIYDNEKWIIAEGDTLEMQILYYAGLMAEAIPDPKAAIAVFEDMRSGVYIKNAIYSEGDVYQNLAQSYLQAGDSAAWEKFVKEGFIKFPDDDKDGYFVKNMINLSLNSGNTSETITYLDKAISQYSDNAQLYDLLGQIYEQEQKTDEAVKNMKKALEIEPNNCEYLLHLGRVYFNLGVEKRAEADGISDINKSNEAFKQSLGYFREAMPFFEKVFELDSKNTNAIFALRSIYYSLEMNSQYKKIDDIYNSIIGE